MTVFGEDIKGLFTKFVDNTNFGRVTKLLDDRINIEKALNGPEAWAKLTITFAKNKIVLSQVFLKNQLIGESGITCRAY